MKLLPKHSIHFLLASSFATLVACGGSSGGDTSGTTSDSGSFSLAVTDAPIDSANAVVVEFAGVSIQPADGEVIEFTFDEPKSIDLLNLQGTASEPLLSNETLPAGDYEWIRLHVNAENDGVLDSYIDINGDMIELWVPSGAQTGLKLVSGFTVGAGAEVDFTIDFDLRKSITLPGPPGGSMAVGGAILKPALRLVNNIEVGSIAGTVNETLVTEQCTDATVSTGAVYVYSGADATLADVSGEDNDPLISAFVTFEEDAYRYEVGFLTEGDYTVAYTCGATNDDPEADDTLTFVGPATVAVVANAESELNFEAGAETVTDDQPAEEETTTEEETSTGA